MFKKKNNNIKRHMQGPLEDKTALHVFVFVFLFFILLLLLLLQRSYSNCPDAHAQSNLEFLWSHVFFLDAFP